MSAILSGLDAKVLVLNRGFTAVRVIDAHRSFKMLLKGIAEVVALEEGSYVGYAFHTWAELSEFRFTFEAQEHDWVRTPRLLRPVRQVLNDDAVYVYHTKINTKPAIEGTVWQWHQDYGSWMRDGCARPDMATFNVMMTDTTEMGGALYLIPGSHKLGRIEPVYDESTSYKFWAMPRQRMIDILKSSPEPVAVTGRAGTCVLFHCNVLHASGHNLSADDRWHIYVSCNTVANKPQLGPEPRPDWVVSRNWNALPLEGDDGVLKAA